MNGADLLEGPGMAIAIGAAFLLLAFQGRFTQTSVVPAFPLCLKGKLDPPNLALTHKSARSLF